MHLLRPIALASLCAFLVACPGRGADTPPDSGDTRSDAAGTPLAYAREVLTRELGATAADAIRVLVADDPEASPALRTAGVTLPDAAESYALFAAGARTMVVGRDATGALYGAMDAAERARIDGPMALPPPRPIVAQPRVPLRGANLFLVLPGDAEGPWWFRSEQFWTEYLDLLARARIDFLDVHGIYNPRNTIFPNTLLYFATSGTYPDVGIPRAERALNVAMLARVVELARARGIRVGLMTYRSDLSIDGEPLAHPPLSESELRAYTREASEDLARRVPGLWRFGFRIGESEHDAGWYVDTMIAGVHAAGTGAQVYARTWGSSRPEVTAIAQAAGGDFLAESKYNGEQLGPPYIIAGGEFTRPGWFHYSYEDHLDPPRTPYDVVFQVRAGGTHRIFRQASFERARRAAPTFVHGGARGFSLEPPHAFFPQRDYYHARAEDRFSEWTFRRDEIQYLLYGRLAYDPETPERVFRAALAAGVGTDALWDAVQAASEVVPWIQSAHTCGPDHRNFAPELEWGGTVAYWSSPVESAPEAGACEFAFQGPFDRFAVAGPFDTAADLLAGRGTARVSPLDVANLVEAAARRARAAAQITVDPSNATARDVVRECVALADLGDYFAHKLRAATALAVYRGSASADFLQAARAETTLADAAWTALAEHTGYIQPFEDRLRMSLLGMTLFHWRTRAAQLGEDPASIESVVADVRAHPPAPARPLPPADAWLRAERAAGPGLASLVIDPLRADAASWTVTATFQRPVPAGAAVRVYWKSFTAGFSDWAPVEAIGSGTRFVATVPGTGRGALFAVEVAGGPGVGWRYPDVLTQTPYRVLSPLPTP